MGTRGALTRDELEAAVAEANVPVLLMVLVHLTGELRWLEAPYLPGRTKALDEHPTGGLPPQVQAEVRAHAVDAVLAAEGQPAAIELPDEGLLERMLSVCMGEAVPPEQARMLRAELAAVQRRAGAGDDAADTPATGGPRVLIVGAGVSGICAAIGLLEAGFEVELVEKEDQLGGTWAANRYPGSGVDTPSHLYSYSFAPHAWSTYFARAEEVHDYLRRVAREFGVEPRIRLRTEVTRMAYDATRAEWEVTTRSAGGDGDGETATRRYGVVITAVGQLNRPKIPALPGLDDFAGPAFHSSRWPDGLDLRGKRVAVVGNGASAMQIVPAIVDEVAELRIFQRSPQWSTGNDDYFRAVTERTQLLHDHVPFYARWYRWRLAWIHNDRVHPSLQVDPSWSHPERSINAINDAHRRHFTAYIEGEIGDRDDLRPAAVPDYPPFGKRMLIDNGWYRALRRDHVELLTGGVRAVTAGGVVDDHGVEHPADVLVLATGFEAQRLLAPIEIAGRDRRTIRGQWGDDDPRAYLGLMVPGFPNFFCVYGPNSNLGHGGSWITIAEAQVDYLVRVLGQMRAQGLRAVEVSAEAHDDYNEGVDRAHERMIWSHPGMDTWYRNGRGRVVTNMPWRIVDYWAMTREPDWTKLKRE